VIQYNPRFMRHAALFYNPLSGRKRQRRFADVDAALKVLRDDGVRADTAETRGGLGTTEQVRQAIAAGADTVFACGGDGTVHDIVQALVGTDAALGIIPMGTANALAHDLQLPLSPEGAARTALHSRPRQISVGRVQYTSFNGDRACRYFAIAVGAGVDAHLFYKLNPLVKSRIGMAAYYAKATRLWLTHPLENFAVEVDGEPLTVSQVLAVRIRNFGGVLRELAPGASLERNDLRLVLFRTRSRVAYLRYILRGLFGQPWTIHGIDLVHGTGVACRALNQVPPEASRIYVEADGELLGTLPAEISMAPDRLNILAP
jgi:diacylglycerol kinase (ATP)